jgi:hypothetical protein
MDSGRLFFFPSPLTAARTLLAFGHGNREPTLQGETLKRSDALFGRIVEAWERLEQNLEAAAVRPGDEAAGWEGGVLSLFDLLRGLLLLQGTPRASRVEQAAGQALEELLQRVDGHAAAPGQPSSEAELRFLTAFNEYLMTFQDERLRLGEEGGLALQHLSLTDVLKFTAEQVPASRPRA